MDLNFKDNLTYLFISSIFTSSGTSLVVQWLRLCLPMQGTQVQPLVRELRYRTLRSEAKKQKNY